MRRVPESSICGTWGPEVEFCPVRFLAFPPSVGDSVLEDRGDALLEDSEVAGQALLFGERTESTWGFIERLKGEAEGSVVHGHEPLRLQVAEAA